MIDHEHPLEPLAANIDWTHFDELFGATYSPGKGRPGCEHTPDGGSSLPQVHL